MRSMGFHADIGLLLTMSFFADCKWLGIPRKRREREGQGTEIYMRQGVWEESWKGVKIWASESWFGSVFVGEEVLQYASHDLGVLSLMNLG